MTTYHYANRDTEFLHSSMRPESRIRVGPWSELDLTSATNIALKTIELARALSISTPNRNTNPTTPYSGDSDGVTFEAPLLSQVLGDRILFLRGWTQFQSCIKGFNALGLMAEQIDDFLLKYEQFSQFDKERIIREFLLSRQDADGRKVFTSEELDTFGLHHVGKDINSLDLAIWSCFANRTIVCSTSSNMGISLHEALRLMQCQTRVVGGRTITLLNKDEGRLIIWCPDERADFMNQEKATLLRSLEAELPKLTTLRTYINRQQRDPGALNDALMYGGYFFPTNPQSMNEVQNLLFVSLASQSTDPEKAIRGAVEDPQARFTLESLGCQIDENLGLIEVRRGVEGGIHGLMLPYFLMLEEILGSGHDPFLSTWNQASIGAALAAAVLADNVFQNPSCLRHDVRAKFEDYFPNITRFSRSLERSSHVRAKTELHGVFDIANIQSLAQLLGVVVTRHLAGRSTAYVGLGSSSYSNGNRCFEIIDESFRRNGVFRGRDTFHPATHSLNPIAQALIFGEDVLRILNYAKSVSVTAKEIPTLLRNRARKPEPAGAAALAGYLLARLDTNTLSVFEIGLSLRLLGFNKSLFLEFVGQKPNNEGEENLVQLAFEEGPYMGQFCADILNLLEWPLATLHERSNSQVENRSKNEIISPINTNQADAKKMSVIYLTGDNTEQVSDQFLESFLAEAQHRLEEHQNKFQYSSVNLLSADSCLSKVENRWHAPWRKFRRNDL